MASTVPRLNDAKSEYSNVERFWNQNISKKRKENLRSEKFYLL